jgi:hypothetical protein
LAAFTGQPLGPPFGGGAAVLAQRAQQAARRLTVQIVAPRSIIACAKSPARRWGDRGRGGADRAAAAGRGVLDGKSRATTRSTLASTTTAAIEGDRRHRRRIGAKPGQRAQALLRYREGPSAATARAGQQLRARA